MRDLDFLPIGSAADGLFLCRGFLVKKLKKAEVFLKKAFFVLDISIMLVYNISRDGKKS